MAKFFGNLHLVLVTGLVLAIVVMMAFVGWTGEGAKEVTNDVLRWLHAFFGILWIGLLYYLNFVQVPTMPKIPAELKPAVTGHIAPNVFFYFRWAALATVVLGLAIAFHDGYGAQALTLGGNGADGINLIGIGMWMGLIMAFNVWFIIWPAQKKILGVVDATAEEKAAAAPRALAASRTNLLLSLPMLYCMVSANLA
ncbi:urate hydroxylase PuuD [Novosphingobium tardum]|uniref:Urate hydroxylase PuuD n=1 Tax=Novosphingobium tardum TaxID=1538021 RepID=A0ABV8RP70_9SPHN